MTECPVRVRDRRGTGASGAIGIVAVDQAIAIFVFAPRADFRCAGVRVRVGRIAVVHAVRVTIAVGVTATADDALRTSRLDNVGFFICDLSLSAL